jgi:hypothetical protein
MENFLAHPFLPAVKIYFHLSFGVPFLFKLFGAVRYTINIPDWDKVHLNQWCRPWYYMHLPSTIHTVCRGGEGAASAAVSLRYFVLLFLSSFCPLSKSKSLIQVSIPLKNKRFYDLIYFAHKSSLRAHINTSSEIKPALPCPTSSSFAALFCRFSGNYETLSLNPWN